MSDQPGTLRARTFSSGLAVRVDEVDEDGRTVFGRIMPYGETVTVDDGFGPYQERFEPGAFNSSLERSGDRVKLFTQHNRTRLPIGKLVDWEDTDTALEGAFRVSDTADGNDALTLIRDDVVGGFSVGFRGIADHDDDGVTVRTEAHLAETSLVDAPAYSGAAVDGIRSKFSPDEVTEWLESLPEATRALIAAELAAESADPEGSAGSAAIEAFTYQEAHLRLKSKGIL